MRKLSVWAQHHAVHARIIIILSRIILVLIAAYLAKQMAISALQISPLWVYFFIAIFFATAATYPTGRSARTYSRRKLHDLVIATSGFAITFSVFAQLNEPFSLYGSTEATVSVNPSPYKYEEAKKLLEQYRNGEKTKFTAKEKRIIKREFKYQLVQYAKARLTGNKGNGVEAVSIIFACIVAVGLLYLVLALACTLSCNGADAAAAVVAILGTAAVIFGLIAFIRHMVRKHEMPKTKSS